MPTGRARLVQPAECLTCQNALLPHRSPRARRNSPFWKSRTSGAFDHRIPGLVVADHRRRQSDHICRCSWVRPARRWTFTGTLPRFRHLSERWPPPAAPATSSQACLTKGFLLVILQLLRSCNPSSSLDPPALSAPAACCVGGGGGGSRRPCSASSKGYARSRARWCTATPRPTIGCRTRRSRRSSICLRARTNSRYGSSSRRCWRMDRRSATRRRAREHAVAIAVVVAFPQRDVASVITA